MKEQTGDKKHTDKFGYASIQVGDSAALFSKHFEEFGPHYGIAAQNVGTALGMDGSAYQALSAAQNFFNLGTTMGLPVVGASALVGTAATTLTAVAQLRHTQCLTRTVQEQMEFRQAELLYNQTKPESLSAVLKTAFLYAAEEDADHIYLVVGDSYQSAQLRLHYYSQTEIIMDRGTDDVDFRIFDSLQEAFAAAAGAAASQSTTDDNQRNTTSGSSSSSSSSIGRVLIYFHSLQPVVVPHDLQIKNCRNFVLRSDAGQGGLQPRLILNGTLSVIASRGKLKSVAICGPCIIQEGDDNHQTSQVEFVKCTNNNTAEELNNQQNQNQQRRSWRNRGLGMQLMLGVAPALLAVLAASAISVPRISSRSSSNRSY